MKMQEGEEMSDMVADPAIFDVSRGKSIAEELAEYGCYYREADNKRINGWQQIRSRLIGEDGKPLIYYTKDCKNLIRTKPIMQYDPSKPEDLDSDLEDHLMDVERYICMSRPIVVNITPTPLEIGDQWWKDFNPHNVRRNAFKRNTEQDYE
jgi:hypothetical protein